MRWTVKKLPDQSLLNTTRWRYIVPQLYKQYPDDAMELNISASSQPKIEVDNNEIDLTIQLDVIIDVMDAAEIIPIACISLVCFIKMHIIENSSDHYIGLDYPYWLVNVAGY